MAQTNIVYSWFEPFILPGHYIKSLLGNGMLLASSVLRVDFGCPSHPLKSS